MRKILAILILTAMLLTILSACNRPNGADNGTTTTDSILTDSTEGSDKDDKKEPSDKDGKDETEGNKTPAATLPDGISGTEYAKLLLAKERLDSRLIDKNSIFGDGVETYEYLAEQTRASISQNKLAYDPENQEFVATKMPMASTYAGADIAEFCRSYEVFTERARQIAESADKGAELIDFVKKHVRIVDKWVKVSSSRQILLHVEENSETIFERSGEDTFTVCHRYKNEKGQNVYELYDREGVFKVRSTYIKGERYEFTMELDTRHDVMVADNSKGYWEVFTNEAYKETESSRHSMAFFVLKNDICYVSSFSTRNFDDTRITVVDKDRSYDIVTMSGQDGRYTFELNLGAFTGIESVTSGEGNRGSVLLIKGYILSPFTQIGEKILVSDVIVHDTAWGIEALVTVDVYDCSTENEAIGTLYEGLNATDLVCKQDIYSVFIAFERANAETKSMKKHFTWNGEKISDAKALDNAYLIELARIESIIGMYTEVKDAEIVDMPSATELEATFPQISESKSENVGYDSGEITASKVSLALSDTLFLSETEKYALFFALKNNATEELVHIGSAGGEAVSYTGGDSFKVTAEDIWLYAPVLSAGDYTLVAYIATEDGIRISKPCVLGVDSIAGAELMQENVSVVAKKASDGALVLTYSEKSDIHTELLLAGKYTYGEFFLLMGDIVYEYGMPSEDKLEKLEGEKYVSMSGDEAVIEDGVYRIKYTVNNGDSERGGYLYVKVTVDLNAERPEEIPDGDNANDENGTDAPEVADSVTVEYVASEAVDYRMLVKLFDTLAAEKQIHVEIREIFYYDYQTNEQVVLPESTEVVPTNVYFVELAEGGGAYFYLKFDAFEG